MGVFVWREFVVWSGNGDSYPLLLPSQQALRGIYKQGGVMMNNIAEMAVTSGTIIPRFNNCKFEHLTVINVRTHSQISVICVCRFFLCFFFLVRLYQCFGGGGGEGYNDPKQITIIDMYLLCHIIYFPFYFFVIFYVYVFVT